MDGKIMRFEIKYKLENFGLNTVHQALRNHPAGFRKIFPDRQVNNIYFDTPEFAAYRDNVRGNPYRRKYRVRWYGITENVVTDARLEVKIKENSLGTKEIHPIPDFSLSEPDFLPLIANKLAKTNGALRPVLMNSYHRSYYGTTDKKFRITIDSDMAYRSVLASISHWNRIPRRDDGCIVELKYDERFDKETDRIIQYLPFRQTKSSKYVTGVILTMG